MYTLFHTLVFASTAAPQQLKLWSLEPHLRHDPFLDKLQRLYPYLQWDEIPEGHLTEERLMSLTHIILGVLV